MTIILRRTQLPAVAVLVLLFLGPQLANVSQPAYSRAPSSKNEIPTRRSSPRHQVRALRPRLTSPARVSPVPPASVDSGQRGGSVVVLNFRVSNERKLQMSLASPPPTAWAVGEKHQLRGWQRQWRRRSQAGRRTRGCQWLPVRARACHLVLPRRGARVLGRRARRKTTSRKRCVSPSNLARVLGTFRGGRLHACTH